MIFCEKIGLLGYVKFLFLKKEVLFFRLTLGTMLLRRIVEKAPILSHRGGSIRKLEWGDTEYMTGRISNAFHNAKEEKRKTLGESRQFIRKADDLFSINFSMIFEKFILSKVLFKKYFFYELILQYIQENPGHTHFVYVDKLHIGSYKDKLGRVSKFKNLKNHQLLDFAVAMMLIPFLVISWIRNTSKQNPSFESKILCGCFSHEEFEAYSILFGHWPQTRFVITDTYIPYFTFEELDEMEICQLGLNWLAYFVLARESLKYFILLIRHWKTMYTYGIYLVTLLNMIFFGRSRAPIGKGNVYFVFEHHDILKTIRNEFIKADGSCSVFFSFLPGIALRYYPEEHYQNYSYVCSSGECLEAHFKESGALTKSFLPTGSYTSNKVIVKSDRYFERIKLLESFKENSVTVTVLCPGVSKLTYHAEKKLMELAQELSSQHHVKVFVRQKPFVPEEKYRNFYEYFVDGYDEIYLTGTEFELFDFLPVTDLFITSFSTSTCEIASRGGNVFFIDYLRQPDHFLFWESDIIDGILLPPEQAFNEIMAWINDTENGQVRNAHKQAMDRFVNYMEFKYGDFETYKKNLFNQLQQGVLVNNPGSRQL